MIYFYKSKDKWAIQDLKFETNFEKEFKADGGEFRMTLN